MKIVEGVIIGLAIAAIVACGTYFYQNSQQQMIAQNSANIMVLKGGIDKLRGEVASVTAHWANELIKLRTNVEALTNEVPEEVGE